MMMLQGYNRWIKNSAKNDGINTTERPIIYLLLFPALVSFMPYEIMNLEWVLGGYFLFLATRKYSLSIDNIKEESLIEVGILISFSILFTPYFIIYLALMVVRIFLTGKFTLSKIIAVVLPTALTWFMALTINTFSTLNTPFYKLINSEKDFYFQITNSIQGVGLITLSIIALLTLVFVNKKNLYKLERNTHYSRITLFIAHLLVISFIRSPETLMILTVSILYGLELLIRVTQKMILKESFLVAILFFSALNIYYSF
tara:strand:- start:1987 stop:2760 length:774 start_codon:yes stop_codon:yes gene_type:complete